MAQYINKDTYVGDTGKQLKDIIFIPNLIASCDIGEHNNLVVSGVLNFVSINILNSNFIEKTNDNFLKVKKSGYYRITLNMRFKDIGYETRSVSAGVGINKTWEDRKDINTWVVQYVRASVNGSYVLYLDADTIISPQYYTGAESDILTGGWFNVEYIPI